MSSRPGTQSQTQIASAILGAAAGRNIGINNSANALVDAIVFIYTPTATVGNRIPTIQIRDAANNILWQCAASANVVATNPVRICAGAGVAAAAIATPLMQYLPLPSELAVPQFASVQIFDGANIDVNDTVSAGMISYAM